MLLHRCTLLLSALRPRSFPAAAPLCSSRSLFSSSATAPRAPASPSAPRSLGVLEYVYAASTAEELALKRAPMRSAHLSHARAAAAAGTLLMGGAWGPGSPAQGGLLIFSAPAEAVQAFAQADPYVTGGLVSSFSVRPWTVVIEAEQQQ